MTRVLVLSDTHIPRTVDDLPKKIYDEIENADMIIHAGDFIDNTVYDKLATLRPLKAVAGNMDSMKLRAVLKQKEVITIEKCRIGIIHGYGAPRELLETVEKEFAGTGVKAVVFGHSHNPLCEKRGEVLYLNPGSPTDTVYAPYNSYGILEVEGDSVTGKIVKL
jgi:putative phosphoesterase